MNHQLLVEMSQRYDDLAIDRANYLTAWQLSQDGNLDEATRRQWKTLAAIAAERLTDATFDKLL